MRHKIAIAIFGSIISLFFVPNAGIYAAVKTEPKKAEVKVPENVYTEDKQNIAVSVKQPEFVLQLKSNPTTGYAWYLREYDNNLLVPVKQVYVKPEKENLIGSPGYELWTFKMKPAAFVVPQQTVLRMVYSRAWQGSDNTTQSVFRISTHGK